MDKVTIEANFLIVPVLNRKDYFTGPRGTYVWPWTSLSTYAKPVWLAETPRTIPSYLAIFFGVALPDDIADRQKKEK